MSAEIEMVRAYRRIWSSAIGVVEWAMDPLFAVWDGSRDDSVPANVEAILRNLTRPQPRSVTDVAIREQILFARRLLKRLAEEKISPDQFTRASSDVERSLQRQLKKALPTISNNLGRSKAILEEFGEDQLPIIRKALLEASDTIGGRDGLLPDIKKVISEAHGKGVPARDLSKSLEERYGISRSRAEFIARDQTLKLNGQINKQKQTDLGITHYRWSTSKDRRVRDSHAALDGTIQAWDNPPNTGNGTNHPGEDYQCRCIAIPIINFDN